MADYGSAGLLPSWMFDERFGQDWPQIQTAPQGFNGGYLDYRWGPENDGGKAFNQFDVSRRYDGSGLDPRSIGESVLMANDPNMPPPQFAPQQPMGPAPDWLNGPPTRVAGGSAMGYAQEEPRQQQPLANFPAQAPQQQSGWDRFGQGINNNAMTLMGLGAGIAGGQGWGNGISQGLRMGMAGAASDRKQKNEASAQQAALQMVAGDTTLTPDMKQAIMRSPQLAQQYAENKIKQVGGTTDDLREFATWIKGGGDKSLPPGTNLFEHYMTKVKQRETENFALTPTPELQADGTVKYFQIGNRGGKKYLEEGTGQVARKAREVETATGTELYDPITNAHLKTIPKNVQEGKRQAEAGKFQAQAQRDIPEAERAAATMLEDISKVKNHPAKSKAVGTYLGQATEAGITERLVPGVKDFRLRIKQLESVTWTQGVKDMVGLGALSNAEGSQIKEARARLNTAQSEAEFDAALDDLNKLTQQGTKNLRAIANGTMQPIKNDPAGNPFKDEEKTPSGPIKWGRDPKTGLPVRQ